MLPSSYISPLLVSILWFCIWFPISVNVRIYFGARMVTFCIIHIGNRKIFLKHHPPPEPQLILLHVSVFSYFTWYMWKASWDSGGEWYPTAQNVTSGRARSLAFEILVCSLENLFFQYNEIISTSKLPFYNPLVMKYCNVSTYFSLDYENCPFTKFSW